jgi:conjugative transfer pilus assembly protein TraH
MRSLLLFLLFLLSTPTQADLRDEMDGMFNSLVNVNNPTAFQGQRRGVLSGGSLYVRNRVMNPNLISIVPPSWRGGCGGIDLFAGSFSFINADEFVQLLRAIAANASGYAFELALNAMCPSCQQEMARLSNIVRELTQGLGSSCEMAKALVDATNLPSLVHSQQTESGLIATQIGAAADFLEGLRPRNGNSPSQVAQQAAPQEVNQVIKGNVVWRALKERQAGAWFRFGGDDPLLEAIMSLTGTVIVGDIPQGAQEHPITEVEPLLTLTDILVGSSPDRPIQVWKCDDNDPDGCLEPVKRAVDLKGMRTRVEEVLLGAAGNAGLIAKARFNQGAPTAQEQAFMELAPLAVVAMLRNLALEDAGAARLLAREAGPVIALEMTVELVDEMIRAVRLAASLNQHHLGPRMQQKLEAAQQRLAEERKALHEQRSRLEDLAQYYNNLRLSLRQQRYRGNPAAAPAAEAAGQ